MRFLTALGLSVAFSAGAASGDAIPDKTAAPEVAVVESNKSYVVKLDCVECPFAVWDSASEVSWQTPPQDNALLLNFNIDTSGTALLLNGKRILPLDPMPLDVKAPQVAVSQTLDVSSIDESSKHDFSLQYEHSLLRDKEPGKFWVQFDVTGWLLQQTSEPVLMDKASQKLVQVLLHKEVNGTDLRIESMQVVKRQDRKQPYRMKCGNLAVVKTTFDPAEWDEFGKFGTWSRILHVVLGTLGGFWYDNFQHNARVLLLALWLAITVFLVRRWRQARQEEKEVLAEDDAESAMPSYQYSVIPVIKIEEYD